MVPPDHIAKVFVEEKETDIDKHGLVSLVRQLNRDGGNTLDLQLASST